ncbi:restriction endonuclease subunit S [Burkholderia sp. MSMB617WGS]|uniref:restriction endonuclease subunit S n=1 Tax=Burkholderia sp. MSMB617WGS TaxID=1637831 RepID=UPI0009E77D9C|nr:restriction endonuclease subunit S [Burkholderia sp. MSMB617WGS]
MSWPTVRFGDIVEFRNGLNYSRDNFGIGLKVISVGDFGDRLHPDLASLSEINPEGVAKADDYLADGDLLFVRSNGNRDLVGRVMLMQGIGEQAVGYSGFCIRGRFLNERASNPAFFAYQLRDPATKKRLTAGGVGANIANVSQKTLSNLEVVNPSREVQDAVVAMIAVYDDLIAVNQHRIALLEEAAHRLYREWFVHLRFRGHEAVKVVDGVPEGWGRKPLGDIASLNYGKALKATDRKIGNVPVYGSSGIVGYHDQALIESGAIVIGRKGNVGSLFYSHVPSFPIDTVFFIEPQAASLYLYLALHQLNFISSDSAVPGLNRTYAHSLLMLAPSTSVASAFDKLVGPLFEQSHTLKGQNVVLTKIRDALLPKLMSGQLDVSSIPMPEQEAA